MRTKRQTHHQKPPPFLPRPSRLILNLGILSGGMIGFLLQRSFNADDWGAFLVTGVCALLGAFAFTVAEIVWRKRHPPHP